MSEIKEKIKETVRTVIDFIEDDVFPFRPWKRTPSEEELERMTY